MNNQINAQGKPGHNITFVRAVGWAAGVGAILLLALVAPFLLGRYCGHGWGLLVAIVDAFAWFYLDRKHLRKGALSTRLIGFFLGFRTSSSWLSSRVRVSFFNTNLFRKRTD
jgi:hypothetical protein